MIGQLVLLLLSEKDARRALQESARYAADRRARINLGLSLLKRRYRRILEIGYGSGLLIPTLSSIADEVYGVDIEPEPAGLRRTLEQLGARVTELRYERS